MSAHTFRSSRTIAAGLLLASALAACGGAQTRAQLRQRPIEERRALRIMVESLEKDGLQAAPPVEVNVGGKKLVIDLPIEGKKVGIVYLSQNDIIALGDHPLTHKKKLPGDQYVFQSATTDKGQIQFVVLYASDYGYDDNEGAEHEATVITAENKLDRDVRDFANIVRTGEEFQ